MDPATITTIVGWFAQPAAQTLFTFALNYVQQRLGLNSSSSPTSQIEPLLDKYLQQLVARLDEDRIAKLYGAFSKLKDATRSLHSKQSLLNSALGDFHEIARISEEGTTGNRPNAELRCMAFVGMVASYTLLQDRKELIERKMIEAVAADAATAEQWFGRDLVREIRARLPAPTADYYYRKGCALEDLERYGEALAAFEQAIRINPNNAEYYGSKGFILEDLERYGEALAAFEQAIRLDPNNAGYHNGKGQVLLDLQRKREALAAFEQAIRLDPNSAEMYFSKALALAELERLKEALAACEYTLRLDPNHAGAYEFKGMILNRLRRSKW